MRGDDGVGPVLIEELREHLSVVCLNVGTTPENYAGKIVKENPGIVLIIDALHLGKKPGEYEVLKKGDVLNWGFTTHDISPSRFIEYLEESTKADILVLGIQPGNLRFGEGLSEPVKQTITQIKSWLIECLS